ncbi:MAG TPA: hypothetical protein V6D20_23380, partial [Candidatus Obscuribacterales bacterium]
MALDILNHALNGILVFVVGLRLLVLDTVEVVEVGNLSIDFGLGIVSFETNGCSNVTEELLVHSGDVRLGSEGVANEELGVNTSKELQHLTASMARDAIIMGWAVGKDGIAGPPFGKAADVGRREARAEVFAERVMDGGAIVLGSGIKGGFDPVVGDPHEVGFEKVQIREPGADRLGKG